MTASTDAFDGYWSSLQKEVAELGAVSADVDDLPIRSTEGSDGYGVRLRSTGGTELFAYYSVPHGEGPFPGLFMAPGYGSVVHVPPYGRRQRYAVLALCARGQRLSDGQYAAAYPGLLTDRADDAMSYPFRGIVADCLRAVDFLLSRPEVDRDRVAAASIGDLAFLSAALRPQISAVMIGTPLLFRDTTARLPHVDTYPLEEFNDLLRTYPERRAAVESTLSLFDPLAFASRVQGRVLVACAESELEYVSPLVESLDGRGEVMLRIGRGFIDHGREEAWLEAATSA